MLIQEPPHQVAASSQELRPLGPQAVDPAPLVTYSTGSLWQADSLKISAGADACSRPCSGSNLIADLAVCQNVLSDLDAMHIV